ncbi:DNA-binding Lrp family transcriptional regulator [Actinoplanes lutulentus]|uniref:AsnC family transcriptional regulator n=1 Tax=Actinoplanes lutulentus TaxID=1287878 RepID=A0A327YY46_9ACTN|nr:Lrp/AsnC family transcriptional regulator [Actinoplanes lutulentus]MBB2947496.1 DNA-binding Lrp family transcriptional regulator [Actinoplanes lutulentus]RAK25652.1 AsnC family transcriptional regulator [Actinoplanes lutulentus]
MKSLDAIDRQILLALQSDGRLSNQELADRVGLSPSPCLRRVRLLEEAGVIAGYRAVLDQEAVGLAITAFVRITLESHGAEVVERVEAEIRGIPEIVEAYLLAGDQDYLLKITVASFASYEDFVRTRLRTIPGLASIQTTFAFGVTKTVSPLPVGSY